jgi:hypothetical protein
MAKQCAVNVIYEFRTLCDIASCLNSMLLEWATRWNFVNVDTRKCRSQQGMFTHWVLKDRKAMSFWLHSNNAMRKRQAWEVYYAAQILVAPRKSRIIPIARITSAYSRVLNWDVITITQLSRAEKRNTIHLSWIREYSPTPHLRRYATRFHHIKPPTPCPMTAACTTVHAP